MTEPTGRRERKKARTRQALADTALELFLAHGYDRVGLREVADAADVSVTTLYKYFPSKEALVFDLDGDLEESLIGVVRDREPGRSVLHALRDRVHERLEAISAASGVPEFLAMIESTPALREYSRRMWLRHEAALAAAVAEALGAPEGDATCAAVARFALEVGELARPHPDPHRAIDEIFAFLERGWSGIGPGS